MEYLAVIYTVTKDRGLWGWGIQGKGNMSTLLFTQSVTHSNPLNTGIHSRSSNRVQGKQERVQEDLYREMKRSLEKHDQIQKEHQGYTN